MERIGVRELRQHASRYLALVELGQTVEITSRGRLIARIVPPDKDQTAYDELVAAGKLIPPRDPTARFPTLVPLPPGTDTGAILDELREERE